MATFEEILSRATDVVGNNPITRRLGAITATSPMESAPIIDEVGRRTILSLENEARTLLVQSTGDPIHWISARIDFNLLKKSDRERILGKIDEIRGIRGPRNVLEQFGVKLYKDFETALSTKSKAFGRIPANLAAKISAGELTANDLIVASMSFTHDMTELQTSVGGTPIKPFASLYKPGNNRFSQEYMEQQAEILNSIRSQTTDVLDNYVVFDIETPGLQKEKGIYEYAARVFEKEAGSELATETESIFFRTPNAYMRSGAIFKDGNLITPTQFMDEVLSSAEVPILDEANGIKNILKQMERTGWTVMGQNIDFDITRLLYTAKNLPEYTTDVELSRLVDAFEDSINRGTAKRIDTALLSIVNLGEEIEIAPELLSRSSFTPHSIENILAQTDVLEYGVRKNLFSLQDLEDMFSGMGTHTAKIDTRLTNAIGQYHLDIITGRHTPRMRNAEFLSNLEPGSIAAQIEERIRPKVFGSAIAPQIPLDVKYISPEILNYGELGRKIQAGLVSLNPEQQAAVLSRLAYSGQAANVSTFDLSGATRAAQTFREVSAQFYDESGRAMTGDLASLSNYDQMRAYQQRLIDAEVPFANLHLSEREATASLNKAASGNRKLFERIENLSISSRVSTTKEDLLLRGMFAEQFGDVFPDTFAEISKHGVFKNSQITQLPLGFVEEALGKEIKYLDISLLPEEFKRIAFNVSLNDEDISLIRQRLLDEDLLDRFSIGRQQAVKISDALSTRGFVQVASISGEEAPDEFRIFSKTFQNLVGEITDESAGNKSPFVVMLGRSGTREKISGVIGGQSREFISLGQVVSRTVAESPELLEQELDVLDAVSRTTASARSSILESLGIGSPAGRGLNSQRIKEALTAFNINNIGTRNSIRANIASNVANAATAEEATQILTGARSSIRSSITEEALRRNAVLKKYAKSTAITAAVALSAYFIYKKAKENSKIDETVNIQDYENSQYDSFRPEAPEYDSGNPIAPITNPIAQNRQSRRLEYMQTAGTTRRLWNRRIGQTNMGNNRYDYLYGG